MQQTAERRYWHHRAFGWGPCCLVAPAVLMPRLIVDPWQKIVLLLLMGRTTSHQFCLQRASAGGRASAPRREHRRGDGLRLRAHRQYYKVEITFIFWSFKRLSPSFIAKPATFSLCLKRSSYQEREGSLLRVQTLHCKLEGFDSDYWIEQRR